jgi:hypothetical protein
MTPMFISFPLDGSSVYSSIGMVVSPSDDAVLEELTEELPTASEPDETDAVALDPDAAPEELLLPDEDEADPPQAASESAIPAERTTAETFFQFIPFSLFHTIFSLDYNHHCLN